jgi:hypothetical protein
MQVCKYKGFKNKHTLLRPHVTECSDFVVCGSDDGAVYIWDRLLQVSVCVCVCVCLSACVYMYVSLCVCVYV